MLRDACSFRVGQCDTSFRFTMWSVMGRLCGLVPFMDIHDVHVCLRDVFTSGSFDASFLYTVIPQFHSTSRMSFVMMILQIVSFGTRI